MVCGVCFGGLRVDDQMRVTMFANCGTVVSNITCVCGWGGSFMPQTTADVRLSVEEDAFPLKKGRWVSRPSASERRGNNFKSFKDFHLNAKARIWP